MLKKMLAGVMIMALTLGTLTGCSNSAQSNGASEVKKEELVIAISADITSLDPQGHNDTKSESISSLLFNKLFKLNADFEVVPDLAESYKQLSDKEWEIKIKQGVKFSDGTDLTSEDVKYSLERSLKMPKVQHVLSSVEKIEATDKYTVKITTDIAFAPFLYTLIHAGTSIVPKAYVEGGGDFSNPVGSGPYTLVEWVSGDKVVLKQNENYYDKEHMGQMKQITFRIIPEGTSRTIALENNEVDIVTDLETIDISKIQGNEALKLYQKPSTRIDYFGMNNEKAPFDNQLVRQALNYAIDKEAVMAIALNGAGIKADSVLAPSLLGYKAGSYTYDIAKAKELLAKAGYPNGFEMKIWASGDERKRIAEVIQGNLMEVGVTATIEMYEWGTYLDLLMKGEGQSFIMGWSSNPDPDSTLTPMYLSESIGGMNFSRINNPEVDKLINAGREELDEAKRIALYNQFHEYIMDQAPIVPLFVKNVNVGANSNLKNVEVSPQGLWNIENIHY